MALDVILAPDVYVNASVALNTPPEQVVQRVLGQHKGECKVTPWILERVRQMLAAHPDFRQDAIESQVNTIQGLVAHIEDSAEHGPDAWEQALTAAAKAAGVTRVLTDHPDLLGKGRSGDVEFVSTEAWLAE